MKIYEIILIGVALAIDAFSLTVANSFTYKNKLNRKKEWAMPITFSIFQFLMPIIGFYIGSIFESFLSKISGFLTAGIFFILAVKIVIDIIRGEKEEEPKGGNFTLITLLIQGVATSIDALLIGVSFTASLTFSIFIAAGIIGIVTFIIVTAALFIGKGLGKILGKYATYLGALILFALAIKNFITAII